MPNQPGSAPLNSPEAVASDGASRLIKKYPNRRLYDTATSTYITLLEIKRLVMAFEPVVVRDAKTGEDITRAILLQIILEAESADVPLFSEEVLANLIRFYGQTIQGHVGAFLEGQLQMFTDWQSHMRQQPQALTAETWAQFMQWQTPLLQNMLSTLMQPGAVGLADIQEKIQHQIQKNTEQMLSVFRLPS